MLWAVILFWMTLLRSSYSQTGDRWHEHVAERIFIGFRSGLFGDRAITFILFSGNHTFFFRPGDVDWDRYPAGKVFLSHFNSGPAKSPRMFLCRLGPVSVCYAKRFLLFRKAARVTADPFLP